MTDYERDFNNLSDNGVQSPDILKIVEEDIMRRLYEWRRQPSLKILEGEIQVALIPS
jgi:hypothetical protein